MLVERGWSEAVVKPAVSAGAKGTVRLTLGSPDNDAAIAEARGHGDVLVQPFVAEVAAGETSIMVIDGQAQPRRAQDPGPGGLPGPVPSRRDRGRPRADAGRSSPWPRSAVEAAGSDLLYARVDMVTPSGGAPLLMELELIEPFLFLDVAPPGVVDRVVAAVRARLG